MVYVIMIEHPTPKNGIRLRNIAALLLSFASFFFLVPGVYWPMLSIASSGKIAAEVPVVEETGFFGIPEMTGIETRHMKVNIFDSSRSITNTVRELWQKRYRFVAAMIFLFSVIIPVLKGLIIIYVTLSTNEAHRRYMYAFANGMGRWSMCDVFITAVFLAYLSTGAGGSNTGTDIAILGHSFHVNVLVGMHAKLEMGFWCFLTYCILSLMAVQLYTPR